jgi:hypothetical protein
MMAILIFLIALTICITFAKFILDTKFFGVIMKHLKLTSLILLVGLNFQSLNASVLEDYGHSNGAIFSMSRFLRAAVVSTLCVFSGEAVAKPSATFNSSICPLDAVPSELMVCPVGDEPLSELVCPAGDGQLLELMVCPAGDEPLSQLVCPAGDEPYSTALVPYDPINPASDSLQNPFVVYSSIQMTPNREIPSLYYPPYSAIRPDFQAFRPDNSRALWQFIAPESLKSN